MKIYDYGYHRINSELNIVKLMNNLRNLKILIKHSFAQEPLIWDQVKHSSKNIINLEDSDPAHASPAVSISLESIIKKHLMQQTKAELK